MWCSPVKFGGDSGAVQQVSDIGGGFGSASFTARSPGCHAIAVKQEIIAATPAAALRPRRCRWSRRHAGCHERSARACAPHVLFPPFARICARRGHLAVVNHTRRAFRFGGWAIRRVGEGARAASPFNRPAGWVDFSKRGWHERATYLMARVP